MAHFFSAPLLSHKIYLFPLSILPLSVTVNTNPSLNHLHYIYFLILKVSLFINLT